VEPKFADREKNATKNKIENEVKTIQTKGNTVSLSSNFRPMIGKKKCLHNKAPSLSAKQMDNTIRGVISRAVKEKVIRSYKTSKKRRKKKHFYRNLF
jgi:hypothetical protein